MKRLVEKLKRASSWDQLYLAGGIFLGLSLIASPGFLDWKGVNSLFLSIAAPCFGVGFLLRTKSEMQEFWSSKSRRVVFYVGNVIVWGISNALAKNLVSLVLGLPSQDFETAVLGLTVLSYVPMAVMLLAFLTMGFGLVALFGYSLADDRIGSFRVLGHSFGALAISGFCIWGLLQAAKGMDYVLPGYVKAVAYLCDFQPASRYPGVRKGERVRLHENGVISTATLSGNDIQIDVTTLEERLTSPILSNRVTDVNHDHGQFNGVIK